MGKAGRQVPAAAGYRGWVPRRAGRPFPDARFSQSGNFLISCLVEPTARRPDTFRSARPMDCGGRSASMRTARVQLHRSRIRRAASWVGCSCQSKSDVAFVAPGRGSRRFELVRAAGREPVALCCGCRARVGEGPPVGRGSADQPPARHRRSTPQARGPRVRLGSFSGRAGEPRTGWGESFSRGRARHQAVSMSS